METPFLNRDLSWLQFNGRVLREAADTTVPLLERLRFLAIYSSNLDEFSRVRTPIIFALEKLKKKTKKQIQFEDLREVALHTQQVIKEQLDQFGRLLTEEILPQLANEGIVLYYNQAFLPEHEAEVEDIFWSQLLSFIQPVYLQSKGSFLPANAQPYLLVALRDEAKNARYAFVNIPSDKVARFEKLSSWEGKQHVCFIDDIIRTHLPHIFPGMTIEGVYSVKFNRDAELQLDEEFSGDILNKVEKSLQKRDLGAPSRFLYEQGMPTKLIRYLSVAFGLSPSEMYEGRRYHNLKDLMKFPAGMAALEYPAQKPLQQGTQGGTDFFEQIVAQDALLHFPYQSYNPILRFFNQAAIDPSVSEIYISLYRVAEDSHIVNALISASRNGKKVTVFVELKARFDEANNIRWSRKMKEAGIRLIYSIPNIKVHSKIALVIRSSEKKQRHLALISTGNFNETTARFYTDHTLFTAHPAITQDLLQLFRLLQKRMPEAATKAFEPHALLISGINMIARLEQLITAEEKKAKAGKPALIRLKMNSLEEQGMITRLYEATQKGVKVHAIVRGICCARPQIKGMSEGLAIKRLVGRYLEHSRIFIFGEGQDAQVFMGSSDWMTRNLYHRVEVVTPIYDEPLRKELIDYFEVQWSDTAKADVLQPDGQYNSLKHATENLNAQDEWYHKLSTCR